MTFLKHSKYFPTVLAYLLTFSKPKIMSLFTKQYEHEIMQSAKLYILNNLEQPLTIALIAQHICQSESSLKRKFRAAYDTPVYQFIQHSRIIKAKELLDTRQYIVTQVAYEVGYSNISHFSKAFKKYIGCSPGEYLRMNNRNYADAA